MPLIVNLRQVRLEPQELCGELSAAELDAGRDDAVVHLNHPLEYDLTASLLEEAVLVQGELRLTVDCECVRCLAQMEEHLELPDFAAHLPLEGEDAVAVVDDCVDLTPYLREDILLALPQHPLCKPDCRGLSQLAAGGASGSTTQTNAGSSAWAALNQLKLKD
ncbi:MAG: hypothetical protein B9S33_08265 [Pedosphaera sp. Tous-C6FEB]|nr:MAG: hypothetical protein B9S33_08265 [Pedosphaera sp. Tous-C6FEB]